MSKRAAEGERVGYSEEIADSSGSMDVPRKANAAAMARRKIATAKGHRSSTATRGRPPLSSPTPAQSSTTDLANGSQPQQNGFLFGSQSFGGSPSSDLGGGQQQSQSVSFPSSFAPPSGQFDFAAAPVPNNPFSQQNNSNAGQANTNGIASNGFQGSIFNFQPSQPAASRQSSNGAPMFPPQQPLPQTSSLFGPSKSQQQPQTQQANPFQFNSTPAQNPAPTQDKPGKPCFCAPGSTTHDHHQNYETDRKPIEPRAEKDIFGISFKQPSTPNVSSQAAQAPTSLFSTQHSSQGATSPTDMMMSTSPDTSPKTTQPSPKKQNIDVPPPPNPFASIPIPKSPLPDTSLPPNNIFGSVVKPTATPSMSTTTATESTPAPNPAASLFDRISYPDPIKSTPSSQKQQTNTTPSVNNIFGNFSKSDPPRDSSSLFLPDTKKSTPSSNVSSGLAEQDPFTAPNPSQDISIPSSSGKSIFDGIPPADKLALSSSQNSTVVSEPSQVNSSSEAKPMFSNFTPFTTSPAAQSITSTSNMFAQANNSIEEPTATSLTPVKPPLFSTSFEAPKQPAVPVFGSASPKPAAIHTASTVSALTSTPPSLSMGGPTFSTPKSHLIPEDDDEHQRRTIAFRRLRALDDGLRLHLLKHNAFGAELDAIMLFHKQRRQAIAEAAGIKLDGIGSKRKAEINDAAVGSPEKRTKFQQSPQQSEMGAQKPLFSGALTNGIMSQTPFSPEKQPVGAKRKADEGADRDEKDTRHNESTKRTRPDEPVSYPSLPANGSQTSQLFASIVGNTHTKSASVAKTASSQESDAFEGFASVNDTSKPNGGSKADNGSAMLGQFSQPQSGAKPMFPSTNLFGATPMFPATTTEASNIPAATTSSIFSGFQTTSSKASTLANSVPSSDPQKPTSIFNGSTMTSASTPSSDSASPAKPPVFKPAVLGAGTSTNFLAQFGKKAEESEKNEREKRKAEDYDSEEENEEEWERKDAEQQAEKKRKLLEASKGKIAIFGAEGFVMSDSENAQASSAGPESKASSRRPSDSSAKASFTSVLDGPPPATNGGRNIFAHLSDNESAVEGSKHGDADDEETGSEGEALLTTPTARTSNSTGGLFNRVGPMNKAGDGEGEKKSFDPFTSAGTGSSIFLQGESSTSKANPFDTTTKSNPFTLSTSTSGESSIPKPNIFGSSPSGDNTWKPESPIKFSSSTISAPELKVSSPSPVKSSSFSNLFGAPTTSTDSPFKAPTSILGSSPTKPSVGFDFGSGKIDLGNSFLKPKATTLAPQQTSGSDAGSRATSPGLSTAGESANESAADDEGPKDEQIDLLSGADEEGEDKLFEVRAKAIMYDPRAIEKDSKGNVWPVKGVGPLRVLKNKETKKTRILMRADPSGKIVLNTGLIKGAKYEHNAAKSVKFMIANEDGSLSTYVTRTGKDEDAKRLAGILEENKND